MPRAGWTWIDWVGGRKCRDLFLTDVQTTIYSVWLFFEQAEGSLFG